MATESRIRMFHSTADEQTRLPPNRSGSAPPTVEGSFAALRTFIDQKNPTLANSRNEFSDYDSEESMRTDPAYIAYYYANVNLNPRLPPPLISHENRHIVRLIRGVGVKKLPVSEGFLSTHKEEPEEEENHQVVDTDQISESANASGDVHNSTASHADSNDNNIGSNNSAIESKMKAMDITGGLTREDHLRRLQILHMHDQNIRFQATGSETNTIAQGVIPPLYATTDAYTIPQGFPNPQFSPGGFSRSPVLHPQLGGYLPNSPYPMQMSFFKAPMESLQREIDPFRGQIMYQAKPHVQNAYVLRPIHGRYFQPNVPEAHGMGLPQFFTHSSHLRVRNDLAVPRNRPDISAGFSDKSDDCKNNNSFLELLKSSSSKKLELLDILRQIVEFSSDQHGSRFIQQKLEHCSTEEKDSVFKEIIPCASKLMTDVFGNYVIQKFFEHGSLEQRKRLGEQLTGQVLSLSLQMYGCRVIQKALEVIELDQKVKLVQELDGHVTRCVHDQNGNHVIQKCIESIPAEKIGFIIYSFYGEVSALSSHPYGCRVIQRVLEHCSDEKISRRIVDEILDSACKLAEDPYGNYVTQHILEMGKPHERSQIIRKLTGNFKQMSQLKYASNVVEKCLKHGSPADRDLIIEEFLAVSENDDALLMLVKDQFANYVVQKIFDLGTVRQKEVFLNCIKSNIPMLKRFTYAKQIVARYDQLTEESGEDQT